MPRVTARTRPVRRFLDTYGRWWDIINSFAVIFVSMGVMLWLMYELSLQKPFLLGLVGIDVNEARDSLFGTFISVFVSGSAGAIIWIYKDCLKRWTTCSMTKANLLHTLLSLHQAGALRNRPAEPPYLEPTYLSSNASALFRNHAAAIVYMNPDAFRSIDLLYQAIDSYEHYENKDRITEKDARKVRGKLARAVIIGCSASRQLGASDAALPDLVADALECMASDGAADEAKLTGQQRRYVERYFRLNG